MKILMLGWEYPPKITGGLGKACEGLTIALAKQGVELSFVVPKLYGEESTPHMRVFSSAADSGKASPRARIKKYREATWLGPYGAASGEQVSHYSGDLFAEVDRYTERVLDLVASLSFDGIHAHDWMTFPSGWEAKALSARPLMLHVHSLEQDRSPFSPNREIQEIEAKGFWQADRIFAVSEYTAAAICRDYGVARAKIEVVHNGHSVSAPVSARERSADKTKRVLFLGRVTEQKGPGYFVKMARDLAARRDDVRFVVAGDGDGLPKMKEEVERHRLTSRFEFPGFLTGDAVTAAFRSADVYVMPSVSEPFGLAAVEAIEAGTPVVLSRQSGVSEVLRSAPRADFWETRETADYVEEYLDSPELGTTLVRQGRLELGHLDWNRVGARVVDAYARVMA